MNSQLDGASAGAHTQNQAEADVLAFLGNITVTHQLNNLEELFDVEVLLAGNDIEHLVELVLLGLFFLQLLGPSLYKICVTQTHPTKQLAHIASQGECCAVLLSRYCQSIHAHVHKRRIPTGRGKAIQGDQKGRFRTYRRTVFPSRLPSLPGTSCVKSIKTDP
jgi:hypothetical protein